MIKLPMNNYIMLFRTDYYYMSELVKKLVPYLNALNLPAYLRLLSVNFGTLQGEHYQITVLYTI